MFKPDRVGTPNIHQNSGVGSVANFTWTNRAINDTSYSFNVINASPLADFGYSNINWSGTEQVLTGYRVGVGHQFTVTQPLSGNVVGIELIGHISVTFPGNSLIIPYFGQVVAAAGALWDPVTVYTQPAQLAQCHIPVPGATTAQYRNEYYKTQVITELEAGATYVHGFQLLNFAGANYDISWISAGFGVRQLNDQQSIGYRDTLR